MTDVVVGVIALVIGVLLCLRGSGAMRVLLAVWGGFSGFGLGAALAAALTDQGYLATALGWVAALVLAVVFAALAYLFFALAVVLAFASMGFVLGQTIAAALGASAPWLLIGIGVIGGVVLGLLAVATNLPELVLIVVSAFAGAGVAVAGLMLLLHALSLDSLTDTQIRVADQPLWYVGQLVLAVVGVIVQVRHVRRRQPGTVRQSWAAAAQAQ
ncbi:DUF4203 domain-containing protein [Pseudactinotalea sp. HY160]|uniref:DUF4203 domain-containing protein n=1 Tax=Pseudactinotalea sp. HY160 TaxID=2654490 RepID=UPI00128E5407|nr:DUF4203 domain-containing protein [Pseudactinotalea sp. HY160]MPV49031.1 DUF4203 domain-containing protein [Pseudactinotalea sp. HY160]